MSRLYGFALAFAALGASHPAPPVHHPAPQVSHPAPPAAGGSFDGVYLNTDGGNVAYFDTTEARGKIAGAYTVVLRDDNSPGGMQQSRFVVSGSEGNRAAALALVYDSFTVPVVLTYHWIARGDGNGFNLDIPVATGQTARLHFRRASIAEANGAVGRSMAQADRYRRIREQVLALAIERTQLQRNLDRRTHDLEAIARAQLAYDAAQTHERTVAQALDELRAEAQARRGLAGNAAKHAIFGTAPGAVDDVQDEANYADFAVVAAQQDDRAASDEIAAAGRVLGDAQQVLADRDTHIARLKVQIARDADVLARR